MNFRALKKYLNSFQKVYGIPGGDCAIYHDHINVFRHKDGYNDNEVTKTSYKDLYFMHSAAKLINCTAIMQMAERGLLKLTDKVKDYVPEFQYEAEVWDMMREYSRTLDKERHTFNHSNLSKLASVVSGKSLDDYVKENIFIPLKMKNSYFTINPNNKKRISTQYIINKKGETVETDEKFEELFAKNDGCIITTVGDYALFAETLCAGGVSQNGYRLLSENSVNELINNIVFNETTNDDVFICTGYNGGLVLIDIKKKITIVYAQHVKNCGTEQMEIYPKIREIAYKCLGVNMWSRGFNVFP